jgi:hypothetical protein
VFCQACFVQRRTVLQESISHPDWVTFMNRKNLFGFVVAASLQLAFVHPVLAQSWTLHDVSAEDDQVLQPDGSGWGFAAIASSADGRKLVAATCCPGPLLTSTNSGVTWDTKPAPNLLWTSVASSADGTKLVAVALGESNSGGIYTSADSGATWRGHPSVGLYAGWKSVASSADGMKLVAVGQASGIGGLAHSSDAGATWQAGPLNVATNWWRGVASSADGTKLVAVGVLEIANSPYIYRSSDSGATWVQATVPAEYWSAVASSADGSKLVATAYYPGSVYTSTDSGDTWTKQTGAPPENWDTVASSADGLRLVAGGSLPAGQVYTSADSGVTWVSDNNAPTLPSTPPQGPGWSSVASSADGTKLVALPAALTGVYTLQLDSILDVRFEVFPQTNQFFLCDDFQVVAIVSNTTSIVVTEVAPVSPPTNGVNGVVRALANADPTLPQTIPPHGTATFMWPFRAAHVGTALGRGQFKGNNQGTAFTVAAVAPGSLTILRPDLVVNLTGDQSAADPTDGCADVDPATPGRQTTLRAAIETANAFPGKDTILFDLPTVPAQPDGPTVILTKPLPPVTEACEIRGTSQKGGGWVGISGNNYQATGAAAGLELRGDVSINGLAFHGFTSASAVWLSAGQNYVQGCRFGMNANGQPAGNNACSILVTAGGQQIGGTGSTQGNDFRGGASVRLGGNPGVGVLVTNSVSGTPLVNVVVEGNRFGPLDGSGSSKNGPGNAVVLLNAASCRIGGTTAASRNYFVGSAASAVLLVGPSTTDNDIIGNWFGLAPDGTKIALGEFNGYGIYLGGGAHHNRVGGSSATSRNVISGSDFGGVAISFGAHDNTLEGNWIGLTGDGTSDASNEYGIMVLDGANNRIGGSTPGQRNVISGNLEVGILVGRPDGLTFKNKAEDPGTRIAAGTLIQGNWIGLDHSGTRAIPNGRTFRGSTGAGVFIGRFADGTVVGGNSAGVKNVIGGNAGLGIRVDATAATTQAISGNNIGASVDGLTALPNNGSGIAVLGESVTVIGGFGANQGNLIGYNAGPGINLTQMKGGVPGSALDGNLVYRNAAFSSILLASPRTRNDQNDADSGPNGLQNWPLLLNAYNRNGVTEVVADLSSFAPGVAVRVALFREAGGGGDLLLATTNVTTRSQPKDRYVLAVPLQFTGSGITALATTTDGTSEFSPPVVVWAGPDSDGDGIPDALESQVPVAPANQIGRGTIRPSGLTPTLGDRNADGIPDATQANVTSALVPDTDVWITVAAAPGRVLSDVVALRPLDLNPLPGGNEVWPGAVHFSLAGGTGAVEPLQLWFPIDAPTPSLWLVTDEGWLQLTNASFQISGTLNSVSFNLPAQPPDTAWTVALARPRATLEGPLLTVLPPAYQTIGPSPSDPLPSYSADASSTSSTPRSWVVPVRIALPDNPVEWQLETSVNLIDWMQVEAWPAAGATELELAWPTDDAARFFRWKYAY